MKKLASGIVTVSLFFVPACASGASASAPVSAPGTYELDKAALKKTLLAAARRASADEKAEVARMVDQEMQMTLQLNEDGTPAKELVFGVPKQDRQQIRLWTDEMLHRNEHDHPGSQADREQPEPPPRHLGAVIHRRQRRPRPRRALGVQGEVAELQRREHDQDADQQREQRLHPERGRRDDDERREHRARKKVQHGRQPQRVLLVVRPRIRGQRRTTISDNTHNNPLFERHVRATAHALTPKPARRWPVIGSIPPEHEHCARGLLSAAHGRTREGAAGHPPGTLP